MKSIQTKFIFLILGCLLLSSGIIGGAGIMHAERAADTESAKTMNLVCGERAQEINALLSRIRQSVQTLAFYATTQLESVNRLKTDPEYLAEYTRQLEHVAVNAACNTEGAMAVYVRFNPEWAPPKSGLFWSKTAFEGNFRQLVPTDLSSFSPQDTERVGWYYIPVRNGKPTWMAPYHNKNINVNMISFVIPLYMANQTVGVVGMDIDFTVITDIVDAVTLYTNGYAFLTNASAKLVHHKMLDNEEPTGDLDRLLLSFFEELRQGTSAGRLFAYAWQGESKHMAFRPLNNGMRLIITAPDAEINAEKRTLLEESVLGLLSVSALAVILTVWMVRRLIRPLRELNEAAKKIAAGDLSVSLTQQTKDEVGTLAENFQQTVESLKKYVNYINGLAYRDPLTGVKNKTAYLESEKRLEEQMQLGKPEFAIVMLDLNGLKFVNDTYGHDFGDMLIINACKIICKSFPHSPVFRIGGDEFAVILEHEDYKIFPELLEHLQQNIAAYNEGARSGAQLSIARGIAVYESDTDLVFANVFKRADDAMYQNKAAMKAKA